MEELLNELAEKAERLSYPRSDNISGLALRFISNEASDWLQQGDEAGSSPGEEGDELKSAIEKIEQVIREYEKEIDR
jgi:hypothetical protein